MYRFDCMHVCQYFCVFMHECMRICMCAVLVISYIVCMDVSRNECMAVRCRFSCYELYTCVCVCECVCVCVHMYVCALVLMAHIKRMHTCTYAYMYVCIHVRFYAKRICKCKYFGVHKRREYNTCMDAPMYICTYVYMETYVRVR
jgi:hypothetical protein